MAKARLEMKRSQRRGAGRSAAYPRESADTRDRDEFTEKLGRELFDYSAKTKGPRRVRPRGLGGTG